MLIVLAVLPVASPSESLFLEESVAQVAFPDHVGMVLASVEIRTGCGWFYHFLAVSQSFVVGVVEGVDVYGKSSAMFRDGVCVRDESEVEARGVVGSHGPFVVCVPIVDEPHPLNRIFCPVEFVQNVEHIVGYGFVDHHFSHDASAFLVGVQTSQIAQLASWHSTILLVCFPLHHTEDVVGNGHDIKEMVLALFADALLCDGLARVLCFQGHTEQRREHDAQKEESLIDAAEVFLYSLHFWLEVFCYELLLFMIDILVQK